MKRLSIRSTFALSIFGVGAALFASLGALTSTPQAQKADSPAVVAPKSASDEGTEVRKLMTYTQVAKRVDQMIAAEWQQRDLKPSDDASDLAWLRRVYLDTMGRIPTITEVEAFLANESKSVRIDTINTILESEGHAEYHSVLLRKALINTGGQRVRDGLGQLNSYLEDSIVENKPWDQMAREMVGFSGEVKNGNLADAGGYMLSMSRNIPNLTGNVARAFMGIEIQCVQCHDDFMVDVDEGGYYQKDFQKMAAIFSRTNSQRKSNNRMNRGEYNTWIINDRRYTKMNARQRRNLEARAKKNPNIKERLDTLMAIPTALRGPEIEGKDGGDLRAQFATWMTDDNILFARTMVNRMWSHYLKRGFVEPVDDFSVINEPTMPKLLEFLAKDFMANGYDLRRLTKIILSTKAYQLSSELKEGEASANDRISYSRGYVRQLGALESFNSLVAATSFDKVAERSNRRKFEDVRAQVLRSFLFSFDDDEEKENESFSGTIPQALMMMNGDFLNNAVNVAPGSQLYSILKGYKSLDQRIDAMYLAALTRKPSKSESNRMRSYIKNEGKGSVAAYEDVFWALVNSAEFLINH